MRRVVVVLLLAAAVWWLVAPTSLAVLGSDSMEPFARRGDLLVHREVDRAEVAVGDVVTVATADRGLVTHRVVDLVEDGGYRGAVLQGDRSRLPDPGVVTLDERVDRVVLVVPRFGTVLRVGAVPLLLGLVLVAGGLTAVRATRPARTTADADAGPATAPAAAADAATAARLDPRVDALLATCEQLEEDGLAQVVLADLVRVRTAALLGLPAAERSGAVLAADDGVRFYVLGLADADLDALSLVPAPSRRRVEGTAAVAAWWEAVRDRVPDEVHAAIAPDLARWG